jgi:cbb3-type cytochrome oxidase subunit 1
MLPQGFLGTRADLLMDLVLLSFIVILPAIGWSWWQARRGRYAVHKTSQLTLAAVLAVAVALFEIDLKLSGGIFELTRDSAYAGTTLLNSWIYGHTLVAILTTVIWLGLIIFSLVRFPKPPVPGPFSAHHRLWGRLGMVCMMLAGASAFPLYYYGFMR